MAIKNNIDSTYTKLSNSRSYASSKNKITKNSNLNVSVGNASVNVGARNGTSLRTEASLINSKISGKVKNVDISGEMTNVKIEAGAEIAYNKVSLSGKASLIEAKTSIETKFFGKTITLSGEIGIGVALGGNTYANPNSAGVKLSSPTPLPGVYSGLSIDIRG